MKLEAARSGGGIFVTTGCLKSHHIVGGDGGSQKTWRRMAEIQFTIFGCENGVRQLRNLSRKFFARHYNNNYNLRFLRCISRFRKGKL